MSQGVALAYGALGGLAAWIVLFALPELRTLREIFRDHTAPNPRTREYVVFALLAVCVVFLGCLGPILFEAADAREALLYGLTAEALVAGVIKAALGI